MASTDIIYSHVLTSFSKYIHVCSLIPIRISALLEFTIDHNNTGGDNIGLEPMTRQQMPV